MRILQINASYKPAYLYGGPTMSVSVLSEQLANAGNEVWVFTTTANGAEELPLKANNPLTVDGVNVIYFDRITKDHTHFSPKLLTALIKQVRSFDVVHIHAWWNLVSVLSCFIALSKGARVIVSPRGTLSRYSFTHKSNLIKRLFHQVIGKRLLKRCVIHVTSDSEQQELTTLIAPEHVFNIPNFVSLPVAQQPVKESVESGIKLLFLSRIDEKKGLDVLFNALAFVTVPWSLGIAGNGDERYIKELKTLAETKGIDKNIIWMGFIQADKFNIYRSHDFLVLPSRNENFGNVVIESLSVGTPVLISKHVGLAGFIEQHNAGWVFDLNPAALKTAIELAAAQKDKTDLIRATGRQLIEANFGTNILIDKYLKMYKQVAQHDGV